LSKLSFLFILFVAVFILQQSHFIEAKKVMDPRLGVAEDQYSISWNNLKDYVLDIPEKIKELFAPKSKHHR